MYRCRDEKLLLLSDRQMLRGIVHDPAMTPLATGSIQGIACLWDHTALPAA